ncbi:dynein regulatory complex subunit 4-like isoform 3-T4 [Synchiropus picturatus]
MVEHIMLLRDELDREREERNYFQLERDQVQNIWEVTRRKLENHKAELKNLEKEIEDNEQRHQVEIKVYKQKVKHLHCEHQNTMSELKADAQRSLEEKQNQQQKLETELREKMAAIKINQPELDIEKLVNQLIKKHNEDMNETRKKSEKQLEETSLSYKIKLEDLRQELSIKRMTQTSERQDHWNSLMDAVVAEHMTIFDTAVAQLNDTVQSSLDEKDSLKAKQ